MLLKRLPEMNSRLNVNINLDFNLLPPAGAVTSFCQVRIAGVAVAIDSAWKEICDILLDSNTENRTFEVFK